MARINEGPRPTKPYPQFPLSPHASGKWARRIQGKVKYFGKWDDPTSALEEMERYLASIPPPRKKSGPAISKKDHEKNREYGRRSREKAQRMTYLLSDGEFYKIGTTISPAERAAKVQLGNAREIVVVAMAIGDFEKQLHEQFSHLRVRGEWFRRDDAIVSWFSANGLVNLQSEEYGNANQSG